MAKYRIEGQVYEAATPDDAYALHAQKAAQKPGMAEGLMAQFGQGLSLGGADELTAGLDAATGGNYQQSMAAQKASREAFSREHPLLSGIAVAGGAVAPVVMSTIAGSAAGPPGTIGAATASGGRAFQLTRQALGFEGAQAVGRSNTVLQGAKEGARAAATPGGVAGYLTADPGNRDVGTVEGLAAGTVLGAGLGGGIQGAQNFGQRVTPYLERVGGFLGIRPGSMSWAQPPSMGGGGNVTPITKDEAMILQRLEEGGVTPEMAAQALQKAREAGVPLALVDVGGQPVQRLTRAIRTLPGQASQTVDSALTGRASAAPDRIIGHLEAGIGRQASGNAGAVADDLLRQARADSGPLYQQLGQLPPIQDQAVADVFRIPAVQQVVQRAEANAAKFGQSVNPLFDDQGDLLREPTFVDVDRVKQSLDELLSPTYSMGPRPADAPALATRAEQAMARTVRNRLISLADNAPGGATYKKAREAYSVPARARGKYNEGLDFSRKDTSLEDVRAIRRGNPADVKWYDRGVMEGLRAKVQGVDDLTGQPNTMRQFWGSPEARAKIGAVVNPRRADRFTDRMLMENQAAQTNSFVRSGSQTADKSAEAIDVAADLVGSGGGGPKAVAAAAAQKLWERVRMNANEKTRQLIAEQVVNMNPAQQQAFLERLARLQKQGQVNASQIATVANIVTKQKQASR